VALSTHIFPFYYQALAFKETFPSYGGHPSTDYVVRKLHMGMAGIELLTRLYKTIIPIRDPLACILTREARAPQLRHFYIVDGFLEVIKRYQDHPNVIFFPIDLGLKTLEMKMKLAADVMIHCNILSNNNEIEIADYIEKWEKQNSAANKFREPYEAGDIEKLELMMGDHWAEVEYLKIHGGTIMPFLTKLGYGKLLW
jgi:hypothetical protein